MLWSIGKMFWGCQKMTTVIKSGVSSAAQRTESSAFMSKIDGDLYQSIMAPEPQGPRSRRHQIQQSFETVVLIYASLVSLFFKNDGRITADAFLSRFENLLLGKNFNWGFAIMTLFRFLLEDDDPEGNMLGVHISVLIDVTVPLAWDSWRDMKKVLLDFFVYDKSCEGLLQTLWQRRISTISTIAT